VKLIGFCFYWPIAVARWRIGNSEEYWSNMGTDASHARTACTDAIIRGERHFNQEAQQQSVLDPQAVGDRELASLT
jgi:hypothetical protein